MYSVEKSLVVTSKDMKRTFKRKPQKSRNRRNSGDQAFDCMEDVQKGQKGDDISRVRVHARRNRCAQKGEVSDHLGLIRMFIYFRQMSFLRHLGFLRQRLLHHVAQISKFSGKCRDMSRHLINFFKANVVFRCRDILIRPKSGGLTAHRDLFIVDHLLPRRLS